MLALALVPLLLSPALPQDARLERRITPVVSVVQAARPAVVSIQLVRPPQQILGMTTSGSEELSMFGWCMGGRWSLLGSLKMPDQIDATVIYYGGVTSDKEQLATLQMPILGHFASQDPIVPPATFTLGSMKISTGSLVTTSSLGSLPK